MELLQVALLLSVAVTCFADDVTPHVTFEVTEDLPEAFVGSLPTSTYVRGKFNASVLAQMRFDFVSTPNNVEQSFTLNQQTGVLRSGSSGVDRESHCAGQPSCHVTLQVVLVSNDEWLEVSNKT